MDDKNNIPLYDESDSEFDESMDLNELAEVQNKLCFITALSDCFRDPEDRELDAFDKIEINNGGNANELILDMFKACFLVTANMVDMEDIDLYDYLNLITRLLAQNQVDKVKTWRIPKEPYWRTEEDAKGYACPTCNMGVTVDHGIIRDAYCSSCGQALDWTNIAPGEPEDNEEESDE